MKTFIKKVAGLWFKNAYFINSNKKIYPHILLNNSCLL
jgi:hypothetical protein